jgi:hypothetical protein
MGLPKGLAGRCQARSYGPRLTVHVIDRIDQVHFKLYAAVDRGGYHVTDLLALRPTPDELTEAARWSTTHDVSEGFAALLRDLLRSIGHGTVADRL